MRILLVILALLLPTAAYATVTKDDVKKLVVAKLSDDVILSYIKSNQPITHMSASDIVELKEAGASDIIVKALMPTDIPYVHRPVETRVETQPVVQYVARVETQICEPVRYYTYNSPCLEGWHGYYRCADFHGCGSYYRSYYRRPRLGFYLGW